MLVDYNGRHIVSGVDGWREVTLIPASGAHEVRGLEEIAALVAAGVMPPDTPVVHAVKEVGGGLPAVRVAVPLALEELVAWQHGDRSTSKDIVEALEAAYDDFLEDVRANRVE